MDFSRALLGCSLFAHIDPLVHCTENVPGARVHVEIVGNCFELLLYIILCSMSVMLACQVLQWCLYLSNVCIAAIYNKWFSKQA